MIYSFNFDRAQLDQKREVAGQLYENPYGKRFTTNEITQILDQEEKVCPLRNYFSYSKMHTLERASVYYFIIVLDIIMRFKLTYKENFQLTVNLKHKFGTLLSHQLIFYLISLMR